MPAEDQPAIATALTDAEPRTERLGPYRLLDLIGEGGMGEVWLAEQLEPVRREVAIKLLKLGMSGRDVVARFEAERQMLALMDHPNIAKIYAGGLTTAGRPYFAMELVRGVPLTDYCDTQRLPTADRLRMFTHVCRAVQHAHQKGIIHRDLKPSNVLVTVVSGAPLVKIIDFGIAKAVAGQRLTDKTLHTRIGEMLGTPAYMSPEQADGLGIDVDTRSDIYSLGVMLYELLVGALPYEPPERAALQYAIREHDVQPPSARVRTLATREVAAKFRQTTPEDLRRQLGGDLDQIVLHAMEKDRTRRYETANGFALDIERFLRHEPVSARPPSTMYRLQKFVRRHQAATAAGAIAILGLALGGGAAAIGLVRARASEAVAHREAETARRVSNFLVGLFTMNDPSESRGNIVTAREILDRGVARVRVDLRTEPRVQSSLLTTMGRVYASLGLYADAEALFRDALSIEQQPTSSGRGVPSLLRDLADVVGSQRRTAEADSLLRLALEWLTSGGQRAPDTITASILLSLASVESNAGRRASADTLLRLSLRIQENLPSPDSSALAETLARLAFLHDDDPATYEPVLQRAYTIERAVRGGDHPRTLTVGNGLALMLWGMGRFADAERLLEEVIATRQRVLGASHPQVGGSLMNLGMVRVERNNDAGAVAPLERAVGLLSPGDSAFGAYALHSLGEARLQLGMLRAAEEAFVRSVALLERKVGPTHNWTAQARTGLGDYYARTNRALDAELALRQAIRDQESNWGATHRRLVEPLAVLAGLFATLSRFAEADSLYQRAIRAADLGLVAEHPHRAEVRRKYAAMLHAVGKHRVADSVERSIADTVRVGVRGRD